MGDRQRALNYLGLAPRAGRIALGEEPCGAVCRSGHARLLLVAADAGDHTFRRARSFARSGKPPVLPVSFTKEELGGAVGQRACALAALTDAPLALAFVQCLPEAERPAELLETLRTQTARIEKRRKEEKAHQANIRHGGKKPGPAGK